jgi:Holliday junction resolvase RusA-like endonuclease
MEKSRTETFFFPVEPVAKGRPRMTRTGHAYTPQKTRDAETALRDLAVKYNCKPFENAICVVMTFYITKPKSAKKRQMPTVKPDLDNLIKIKDAFNGILWTDDALIVDLHACKTYADDNCERGIGLTIQEIL